MGSLTAQMLIGSPHPNHDGINPTHFLFLSENSRPAWLLVEQNVFEPSGAQERGITWIPTVEGALEDGLLMIALHVLRSPELVEQARGHNANILSPRVELPSELSQEQREQLIQQCRSIPDFPKIVVSVFRGSLLTMQLPVLGSYGMDLEVCRVGYSRLYSDWTGQTTTEGALGIA